MATTATAGGGFVAGLKAGGGLVSQALENERLDAAEARAADEYKEKVATRERTNKAWEDYNAKIMPRAEGAGLQVAKDVYGQTPEQANAPGGAAQRAAGDIPDSSDLQNVPARGLTPPGAVPSAAGPTGASPFAHTAADVGTRAPSRLEQEQAMMGLSTQLRDTQGIRASQKEQRAIQFDETLSGAMKEKMEVVRDGLAGMNTNMSAYPLLMGKKDKNGYTTLTTIDDKSGKPTGDFKFTDPQLRQIYAAQKLAEGGYGAEAMKMLTDVDKSLGEHFKNWNDATYKGATVSNAATHSARQDADSAARTGIMAKQAANAEARARAGDYTAIGPSQDGKTIEVWDHKMNRMDRVPVIPGMDPKDQVKMMNLRGGHAKAPGADKEVPEAGKVMKRDDGTTYKADGFGGELGTNGLAPSERAPHLIKAGFDKPTADSLEWSPDGTMVNINGMGYRVVGKDSEIAEATAALKDLRHHTQKSAEETKMINTAVADAEADNTFRARGRAAGGATAGLPLFPDPSQNRPNW